MSADVYAALLARADGVCECGCCLRFDSSMEGRATLDHFHGRGKAEESAATCWLLRWDHHEAKTQNRPDALTWYVRFLIHSAKLGHWEQVERALARIFTLKAREKFKEMKG